MSFVIDLVDAVVSELAGGKFSQEFVPERKVMPVYELTELTTVRVSVVPKAVDITGATRAVSQYDADVYIGIQRKVGPNLDQDVALMCDLVEEIADYMKNRPLAALAGVRWLKTISDPVYSQEHLLEKRVFTSLLILTYRGMR